MDQYFAANYSGIPFQLFGLEYLIANLSIVLIILGMVAVLRRDATGL